MVADLTRDAGQSLPRPPIQSHGSPIAKQNVPVGGPSSVVLIDTCGMPGVPDDDHKPRFGPYLALKSAIASLQSGSVDGKLVLCIN